jgi:uncharacterized protein YbjT (DUF2867 family)
MSVEFAALFRRWKMMLITGAAGASGRMIVEELAAQGRPVRALVRSEAKAASFPGRNGVEAVVADMARPATLGRALEGVTTVMLISSADERMAETQCNFVDAAKAAGVTRIVKLSGQESGIGFDAKAFRFTRMHEQIERHIEASGMRWTHLRPSQFMQVYLREARMVAREGVLALPAGEIQLSPVDLTDVAAIAAAMLAADDVDGQSFVITGPEALTMAEIAARIGDAIRRPVVYQPLTVEERRRRLSALGVPAPFLDALDEQALERLRHPQSRVELSAYERFGVRPTTFAEFAMNHRAVFGGTASA